MQKKNAKLRRVDDVNEREQTTVPEPTELSLDKSVSCVTAKTSGLIFGLGRIFLRSIPLERYAPV